MVHTILSAFTKLKHVEFLSHVTFLMTKVSQSTAYGTIYHENFEAEKFCGKLYMQTFAKKVLWNLSCFLLNPYSYEQCHHIKKFCKHAKKRENRKTFVPQNFHGIWYNSSHSGG